MKEAFFQLWLLGPRGSGSTGFQFAEGRSGFRNGPGEAMKCCTAFTTQNCEFIGNDFNAALVLPIINHIKVTEPDVHGHRGTGLSANAGCSTRGPPLARRTASPPLLSNVAGPGTSRDVSPIRSCSRRRSSTRKSEQLSVGSAKPVWCRRRRRHAARLASPTSPGQGLPRRDGWFGGKGRRMHAKPRVKRSAASSSSGAGGGMAVSARKDARASRRQNKACGKGPEPSRDRVSAQTPSHAPLHAQ